jgi:hypothetical protein
MSPGAFSIQISCREETSSYLAIVYGFHMATIFGFMFALL